MLTIPLAQPRNRLLALLPPDDNARILADCNLVDLTFATTVFEPGDRLDYVYFPISSLISLLTVVDEQTLEVGMVGNEGMCGHSLVLGVDRAPLRALVQGSGKSLQLEASLFLQHLDNSLALRQLMHRYIHVLLDQRAQTVACARFHTIEARLARWLLMTQDRAHADTFDITQELLAYMLGVRRAGVTAAARGVQSRGLIRYSRGHMIILDRNALEAASCACYRNSMETYQRTLRSRQSVRVSGVSAAKVVPLDQRCI